MPKSSNTELTGKTVLITRAASQSADLRSRLENLGARVIECPTIRIVGPRTWKPVDEAIRRLETYQWLLFTSANAVDQFMARMRGKPCAAPIAVVGSATANFYDSWARLIARYWGKYIAGNPNVIVQNMPGAGSISAVIYV